MKYLVTCKETREISTVIEASNITEAEHKMLAFVNANDNWKVIEDEIKFIKLELIKE